jgi:endonuclease YncB( thermonuclease family)
MPSPAVKVAAAKAAAARLLLTGIQMQRNAVYAIAIAAAFTGDAYGQQGPRPVRLADGDSFSLGRERYRLYGIDAPELHQDCTDAKGQSWPCGTRARSELRRIIGTHPVQCRTLSTDRFGRNIAVCHAAGRDLAEEMVRAGFATTFDRRGAHNPYDAAQAEARADKRGVWAGTFDRPGEWRRANPRDPEAGQTETPRDWLFRKCAELWQALQEWARSILGR